jgi:Tol biopolymer transport system component
MKRPLLIVPVLLILWSGCSNNSTTPKPTPTDSAPPATVQDLAITSPPGRLITLTWTAPGDDGAEGRATGYEIRYRMSPITEQSWDSATVVTSPPVPKIAGQLEHFSVAGLPDGTYYFAVKAADEIPNWSACSNTVTAAVADVVPPGQVTNLIVSFVVSNAATLSWTAPGNDGNTGRAAAYDLRYSTDAITDDSWDAATPVQGLHAPGDPGVEERFTVHGLETGQTYNFALKTADATPNWSPLSNIASALVEDVTPPGMVTDLTGCSVDVGSATLRWTAPGNSGGIGRAVEYDLRYALTPIAGNNWDTAVPVQGVPAPDTAGTAESFVVSGLDAGQTYYFAVRTADEVPNWSAVSYSPGVTIPTPTLSRLTFNQGAGYGVGTLAWSPDGQKILFDANWTSNYYTQIYTLSGPCDTPVQLTNYLGDNRSPCWSPNGGEIAFVSARENMNPIEIWIMGTFPGSSARLVVSQDGWTLSSCAWSPDGTRIAYVGRDFTSGETQIFVVSTTGGIPAQLTHTPHNYTPAWSPDGTQMAFVSEQEGNPDIWVMPAAGGDAVQVTHDSVGAADPAWSSDGSRIAFSSGRSGQYEIWVMSATGENPVQLTDDPAGCYAPAWSPDGTRIGFVSRRGVVADIWILTLQR